LILLSTRPHWLQATEFMRSEGLRVLSHKGCCLKLPLSSELHDDRECWITSIRVRSDTRHVSQNPSSKMCVPAAPTHSRVDAKQVQQNKCAFTKVCD
jgi:hypothetical protein